MRVVALARDLMLVSRIRDAADRAGSQLLRIDDVADLPPPADVELLLVDWSERRPGWGEALRRWHAEGGAGRRMILYGPHTDLAAHADARQHEIGPMWARSRLVAALPDVVRVGTG